MREILQSFRGSPIVTIPTLEPPIPADRNEIVQGITNSEQLNRKAMLRIFDISEWEQQTRQVARYIENRKNILPVRKGRRCIDGRYAESDSQGMIARPGGDYGYALTLAAVCDPHSFGNTTLPELPALPHLTPEQCFDLVFDSVTADGDQFYMHTDFHDDGTHIGCGHAAAPIIYADSYRLFDERRATRLLTRARERLAIDQQQDTRRMHMEKLEGGHEEQAVVYVVGNKKTVRSQNRSMNEMYFLYDLTRDYDYMTTHLLPTLARKLQLSEGQGNLFFRKFLYVASLQAENSLSLLARTTPRVTVDLDSFRPKVTMLEPRTTINLRGKYNGTTSTGLVANLPGQQYPDSPR